MNEKDVRVQILEEMYEYHRREVMAMERCLIFSGDHYTYRDSLRAHLIAAEWVRREHMGVLKYVESTQRTRAIDARINEEHDDLMKQHKIA